MIASFVLGYLIGFVLFGIILLVVYNVMRR